MLIKEYHQTSFTRNVKGTSLCEKEKAKTRNMKITKEKNLIGKCKYTIKVINQQLINLVGRLKDKSSKIIYIYNK